MFDEIIKELIYVVLPMLVIGTSVCHVLHSIKKAHKDLELHRQAVENMMRNFPELLQRMASSNNREKVDWKKEGF